MESSHVSLADLAVHIGDDLSVNLHGLRKSGVLGRVIVHGRLQDFLGRASEYAQILLRLRREVVSALAELCDAIEHIGDALCHLRIVVDCIVEEDQIVGVLVLHPVLRNADAVLAKLRRVATCLVAEKPCLCQLFLGIVPD